MTKTMRVRLDHPYADLRQRSVDARASVCMHKSAVCALCQVKLCASSAGLPRQQGLVNVHTSNRYATDQCTNAHSTDVGCGKLSRDAELLLISGNKFLRRA